MEEKFYHPDVHVFNNEASDSQPVNAETQDSRLMEKISEDISRKDVEQLKKHFECLVKKYKNYIYQHYAEDLSLETLAEKVYLSSGYLSFIFKKETGMNLNRFIRVVRMEKARELLCSSNMKVAQVSEQVGIPNVSYFCRSFREYYGSSPESYRKGTGEEDENTGSHKE